MLGGYWRLLRSQHDILAFGAAAALLSTPGQTYFIALFVGSFADTFGLGLGQLGTLYLAGTLAAAAILPVIGYWVDRIDLKQFTAVVMLALAGACVVTASATGPVGLLVGFVLLRLTGQGLMMHLEVTSIARFFGTMRGRALSITALGYAGGTAVIPTLVIAMIAAFGWRQSYLATGTFVAVVCLPLMLLLLLRRPDFTRPTGSTLPPLGRWRSLDGFRVVARTWFFWLFLPLFLFTPITSTALIFHIEALTEIRGWSRDLLGAAFVGFAAGHACGLIGIGPLIDRYSARVVMPYAIVPMVLGIASVILSTHWGALFVFMACMGVSAGAVQAAIGAVWAEVYGVSRLGAVRSTATMLMVAGTAAGPAMLGHLLDSGFALGAVLAGFAAYGACAATLALVTARVAGGTSQPVP